MDLQEAYDDVRTAIEEAQRELDALSQRMSELELEKAGLEMSLRRHLGVVTSGSSPTANEWTTLPRTDAVERVMRESVEPMSPREIANRLTELGRSGDSPRNVSAALAYMHQNDRVRLLSRGQWVLANQPLMAVELPENRRNLSATVNAALKPTLDRMQERMQPAISAAVGQAFNGAPASSEDEGEYSRLADQ